MTKENTTMKRGAKLKRIIWKVEYLDGSIKYFDKPPKTSSQMKYLPFKIKEFN